MSRMSGDAGKDIREPSLRIDTFVLAVTIRLYLPAGSGLEVVE